MSKEQNKDEHTEMDLLKMDPEMLLMYLSKSYQLEVPLSVEEGNGNAAKMMAKASAYYTYLITIKTHANLLKRTLKRKEVDKEIVEDMLMRETVLESEMTRAKQVYDTISRMFTIRHQEIDQELKMSK
jgi:hypothetical protein